MSSDSSASERRERKEKKRSRRDKDKERSERKEKDKSRKKRSYDSEDDERERDKERERRRKRATRSPSKSKTRSRSPAEKPPRSEDDMDMEDVEDDWVEKPAEVTALTSMGPPMLPYTKGKTTTIAQDAGDSDDEVGPQPLIKPSTSKRIDERSYGGALLRGEGSAMAAFLADDPESRIPRRGEIGLTSDEIAKYEDVGYVMSGSRHRRMNAVRMRKENQVISAEEKRGILKLQKEERERREAILREEFDALVQERLSAQEPKKSAS